MKVSIREFWTAVNDARTNGSEISEARSPHAPFLTGMNIAFVDAIRTGDDASYFAALAKCVGPLTFVQ